MRPGHLYVLSNPFLPNDCLKIGLTRGDLERRVRALGRMSAIPAPFKIEYAIAVQNASSAERRVHLLLNEHRISSAKEFFSIGVDAARVLCSKIAEFEGDDGPPSDSIRLHHDILCARYSPGNSFRVKKLIYLLMAATVNNTLVDRLLPHRLHVVDGFTDLAQVSSYLNVQRRRAAAALRELSELSSDITCHLADGSSIPRVFEFLRYQNGHAGWRFTDDFRHFFLNPRL